MGRTACAEPQCLYKGAIYLFLQFTRFTLRSVSDFIYLKYLKRKKNNFDIDVNISSNDTEPDVCSL